MATYTKYEIAIEKLCKELIYAFGTTDTWKVVIVSDTPNVSTDSTLADVTEIYGSTQNGYTVGGDSIGFNSTRTGGTITATGTDIVWTCSTSAWPSTGRYFPLYDDTSAANDLWCYWDYGATFGLNVGETMTLDVGSSIWTLT
jgi:hypothetical protein